jgi:hypothetical protein
MGFLYIAKLREFVISGANVYKIGRTDRTINKRFSDYPKGSLLIYHVEVGNETCALESNLIQALKENENMRQCVEYGTEYFEGDVDDIKNILQKIVTDNNENNDNENKKASKLNCPFCQKELSRIERVKYHLENSVCSADIEEKEEIMSWLNMNVSTMLEKVLNLIRTNKENEKLIVENSNIKENFKVMTEQMTFITEENALLKRNNDALINLINQIKYYNNAN